MDVNKRATHRVSLEDRERLAVTGVTDVAEFNEQSITADTEMGTMIIKGDELKVTRLDIEGGVLEIDGTIESLEYSDRALGRVKGSMLSRIFK